MNNKKEPNVFNKSISNRYSIPSNLIQKEYKTDSWFNATLKEETIKSNPHKYKCPNEYDCFMSSFRIELFPTYKQKKILHQWEDIYTFFYNKTIAYIKDNNLHVGDIQTKLKYHYMNRNWIKRTKFSTESLSYAIRDAFVAYNTNIKMVKNGTKKKFNLRYKKITNPRKIIKFNKNCFSKTENALVPRALGELKTSIPIKGFNVSATYHHNKNTGKYYLYVPYEDVIEKQVNQMDFCGIDPGQRTFITGFGISKTKNQVFEFGVDTNAKMQILKKRIDKAKRRKRKRQMFEKYTRQITDLHYKTISFITKNYNNVVIGRMSTSDIVKSNKLAKKVKYSILTLSHFLFRQRLQYKCKSKGINYYEIDEAYTSKSCTKCGNIKHDLGSAKVYNCNKCNLEIDRDVNGARNILIKYFNLKRLSRNKKNQ